MATPEQAIDSVHAVSESLYAFVRAQDSGRGLKGHHDRLRRVRVQAFELMVGRKPTTEEEVRLVDGDG